MLMLMLLQTRRNDNMFPLPEVVVVGVNFKNWAPASRLCDLMCAEIHEQKRRGPTGDAKSEDDNSWLTL